MVPDCYANMVGCWVLVVYRGTCCRVSDVDTHFNGNSRINAAIGIRLRVRIYVWCRYSVLVFSFRFIVS